MQDAPTITWPTEEGALYTVIMTGECSRDALVPSPLLLFVFWFTLNKVTEEE